MCGSAEAIGYGVRPHRELVLLGLGCHFDLQCSVGERFVKLDPYPFRRCYCGDLGAQQFLEQMCGSAEAIRYGVRPHCEFVSRSWLLS